jgi:hypothetical protein
VPIVEFLHKQQRYRSAFSSPILPVIVKVWADNLKIGEED